MTTMTMTTRSGSGIVSFIVNVDVLLANLTRGGEGYKDLQVLWYNITDSKITAQEAAMVPIFLLAKGGYDIAPIDQYCKLHPLKQHRPPPRSSSPCLNRSSEQSHDGRIFNILWNRWIFFGSFPWYIFTCVYLYLRALNWEIITEKLIVLER